MWLFSFNHDYSLAHSPISSVRRLISRPRMQLIQLKMHKYYIFLQDLHTIFNKLLTRYIPRFPQLFTNSTFFQVLTFSPPVNQTFMQIYAFCINFVLRSIAANVERLVCSDACITLNKILRSTYQKCLLSNFRANCETINVSRQSNYALFDVLPIFHSSLECGVMHVILMGRHDCGVLLMEEEIYRGFILMICELWLGILTENIQCLSEIICFLWLLLSVIPDNYLIKKFH